MFCKARLAQSAERQALNLVIVGSSPTVGVSFSRASPNAREWRARGTHVRAHLGGLFFCCGGGVGGNYISTNPNVSPLKLYTFAWNIRFISGVAQWLARWAHNPKVH